MIIAVDGPAGSGKSSVSKIIAKKLNIAYLDTGAMYRIVTYYLIKNNLLDKLNTVGLINILAKIKIDIKDNNFYLNGNIIGKEIRTEEINQSVAKVSSDFKVREFLIDMQRKIGGKQDIILDGRDIGTVVFPNANLKFYLDASPEERAKRRVNENKKLNIDEEYDKILASIKNRDYIDENKGIYSLQKTKESIVIDTTALTFEEVVALMLEKIREWKKK